MPKPQPADIEGLLELKNMLQSIKDAATGAVTLAQHVQVSVDYELENGREQVRKHLERVDLRPKALFKQSSKNFWRVYLGKQEYLIGPRGNFAELDDDEPKFFWCIQPDENSLFYAPSMFQALMAVVLHFCNESQSATAPVITPIDNQPE